MVTALGSRMLTFAEQRVLARPFFTNFSWQKETVEAGRTYYRSRNKKIATQEMQRLQK